MDDWVELKSEDLEVVVVDASDDAADVVVEAVDEADELVWLEEVVVEALHLGQL